MHPAGPKVRTEVYSVADSWARDLEWPSSTFRRQFEGLPSAIATQHSSHRMFIELKRGQGFYLISNESMSPKQKPDGVFQIIC